MEEKSGEQFLTNGNKLWKSMSTVTKVELDVKLFILKLARNFHLDMWEHRQEKSGKRIFKKGQYLMKKYVKIVFHPASNC